MSSSSNIDAIGLLVSLLLVLVFRLLRREEEAPACRWPSSSRPLGPLLLVTRIISSEDVEGRGDPKPTRTRTSLTSSQGAAILRASVVARQGQYSHHVGWGNKRTIRMGEWVPLLVVALLYLLGLTATQSPSAVATKKSLALEVEHLQHWSKDR